MINPHDSSSTRRQWLRTGARWTGLAVVASLWARLSMRQTVEETACVDLQAKTGCRACGRLADCGLPRALSVKHFLENAGDEQRKS